MPEDIYGERSLFGGAIVSTFPIRFQDVSNVRQVPDHQEVFVDPSRDESLIFELLDLKADLTDNESATWFLKDLANEQDAEGAMVVERSDVFQADTVQFENVPATVTTSVGQMAISKGRQGREAQNIVKVCFPFDIDTSNSLRLRKRFEVIFVPVYLANLRLEGVGTDILITAYEPLMISPLSESASSAGAGVTVPAVQCRCIPMSQVFKLAVSTFKVNDWSLFGA